VPLRHRKRLGTPILASRRGVGVKLKANLANLVYVTRHKFFVAVACFREGIYLRGILHDWHKFTPKEWKAYTSYFFRNPSPRSGAGFFKPTDTGDTNFDTAWFSHVKRADHHRQNWALANEEGKLRLFPMSQGARLEMLCDWWGAGRAQLRENHRGWISVARWWHRNRKRIHLHEETEDWIDSFVEEKAFSEGGKEND